MKKYCVSELVQPREHDMIWTFDTLEEAIKRRDEYRKHVLSGIVYTDSGITHDELQEIADNIDAWVIYYTRSGAIRKIERIV